MYKKIFYLLIGFLSVIEISSAGDEDFLLGTKYGISAYYNNIFQAVDMRQLPSVVDSIPRSAVGNSTGISFGAFYEYRFTNRTSLFLRGIYTHHKAEIIGDIPETVIENGNLSTANVKHIINSDLSNIKLEPLIRYRLFKEFSLFGGFNAGIRFSQMFEHDKSLLDYSNFTFPDGSKYIADMDKNVEAKLGIQASLIVGFGYDIPVNYNGKYLICPEVFFETGYSDIGSNLTWDVNTLRLGITLKYSVNPTVKYEIREIRRNKDSIRNVNIEIADIKEEYMEKGRTYLTYDTSLSDNNLIITCVMNRVDTLFYPPKDRFKNISISDRIDNGKVNRNCLKVYAMASDGKTEYPKAELKVEEFLSTSIKPLLNYIFFDDNSSNIPLRYTMLNEAKANRFKIEYLSNTSTLETYYHIMNIVAKRMSVYPDAKITLTGYNSGLNREKENLELSKRRANAVKDYFVNIWKIQPERINVDFASLPVKASNNNDADGIEENRRVEISSDNLEILAPVIINDTLNEVKPFQIRFYNNASTCYNVTRWNLEVIQSDISLIIFRGEFKMPERLIWRLSEAKQTIPKNSEPVIFKLEVTDEQGNKILSKPDTIYVDKKTIAEKQLGSEGDKKVDKYSLILFDFDKAEFNRTNERILEFINERIEEKSKVYIQGYTDRMGNDDYNLNLSNRRAENVASKIQNSKDISFEGIGEAELIYNNELPEGRFYCRTVNITVETEIEK
ncbi:MAG: OmpA family protein [bacterium]